VWAYESRKYVSDVLIDKRPDSQRWQYLKHCVRPDNNISGFEASSLDRLAEIMRKG
jgi:hypothetical protein